jgi:hypothetical protein
MTSRGIHGMHPRDLFRDLQSGDKEGVAVSGLNDARQRLAAIRDLLDAFTPVQVRQHLRKRQPWASLKSSRSNFRLR